MVVVAGGQQGLGQEGAQPQNGSGSLEKLHKGTSERQAETDGMVYGSGHGQGGPFQRSIKPNTRALLPGEGSVEADVCNFRGWGTSVSQGAGGLLGLGVLVLGGRRGAGGCPGIPGKKRAVRPRRGGAGGGGVGGPEPSPGSRGFPAPRAHRP